MSESSEQLQAQYGHRVHLNGERFRFKRVGEELVVHRMKGDYPRVETVGDDLLGAITAKLAQLASGTANKVAEAATGTKPAAAKPAKPAKKAGKAKKALVETEIPDMDIEPALQ